MNALCALLAIQYSRRRELFCYRHGDYSMRRPRGAVGRARAGHAGESARHRRFRAREARFEAAGPASWSPSTFWYASAYGSGSRSEAELDEMTRAKYPDAAAYERATSRRCCASWVITPDRADYVAAHIAVDPARGSGHAIERCHARACRPICARAWRRRRHELQGLQHRRPRDVPQRGADLC